MRKKRRRLWVALFISVALLLGALATGWNVVLVRDYQNILNLARNLSIPDELSAYSTSLILKMILGTLGFIATLGLTISLFVKLLHEMRLNQLQSEFLATVSHELKTPIATMELSSSLIRTGEITETERDRLWTSHQEELRRLREEVEALLEAARWQSKPLINKRTAIHLDTWIQQSFEQWKTLLGPKAVLEREGEPLNSEALVDLRTLNLISSNLLTNAKKFSRGTPHVIIRTNRVPAKRLFSRPRWQVQFEDRGWGFDPADSKRIFHRFFRSRSHAPYAIPGTGLGLYLAHEGSRAMGLLLTGDSPGTERGAVFTLEGPERKL